VDAFGDNYFSGNRYATLRSMKFGNEGSSACQEIFDLEELKREVQHHEDLPRINEPSDELYFVLRKGRFVNMESLGSSEIESWLIHVEYVSSESGSSDDMFRAAERGRNFRDAKKRTVTDVILDSYLYIDPLCSVMINFVYRFEFHHVRHYIAFYDTDTT
jgi:hypothetical protein